MNISISDNFSLPHQLTVPDNKPTLLKKQGQENIVSEADHVSISPEAEEILAKIQAEQAKTDNREASSDFSSQQNDFYNILGRLLDLKGTTSDISSFLSLLNRSIADESKNLTKILGNLIKDAGLGDVTKKITFAEDEAGNIVITGNINAKKKRELAALINKNPELAERIKNQKMKMEIVAELEKEDVSDFSQLSSVIPKLQEILQKRVLQNEESRLNAAVYQSLLKEFKQNELSKQVGFSNNDDELKPLLAMKRGVLSEAIDETKDFKEEVRQFRSQIAAFVKEYNETIAINNDDLRITDFSVRIDEKGNINIEDVQTRGGDAKQNLNALRFLRKHTGSLHETAKELATEILEVHDDQYGDVKEYKHEVVIDSQAFGDFRIESPEADRAAWEKLTTLGNKIGQALGKYWGLSGQFEITFDADGKLSIDQVTLAGSKGKNIRAVLLELNKRLESEDPFNDELTDIKLSNKMEGILEQLVEMKEIREQIHDQKLRELPMSLTFFLSPLTNR
ncbi:MAG: hypothetical protein LBG58_05600 [Planctomycetaceae bacterium]|jgi:hypothetical protein|nr:hypothetical protein [Planctomycetaceae bacterium]